MQIFKHDGKEYIELPKTKDGEYIHVDMTLYGDSPLDVKGMMFNFKNGWTVQCNEGHNIYSEYLHAYYANPQQPEVLDADGVPIKVGDVVYDYVWDIGHVLKVVCVNDPDDITVYCEICDDTFCLLASRLTHTEPDTQEKIDADAKLLIYEYCEKYFGDTDCKREFYKCNICINEHLLNRQREYDKREYGRGE